MNEIAHISERAAAFCEATGFLFGSITKIMTTTLVLQQVERGVLDLDAPVVDYLPEFRLAAPGAAAKMRVRHLVTHTSGSTPTRSSRTPWAATPSRPMWSGSAASAAPSSSRVSTSATPTAA